MLKKIIKFYYYYHLFELYLDIPLFYFILFYFILFYFILFYLFFQLLLKKIRKKLGMLSIAIVSIINKYYKKISIHIHIHVNLNDANLIMIKKNTKLFKKKKKKLKKLKKIINYKIIKYKIIKY